MQIRLAVAFLLMATLAGSRADAAPGALEVELHELGAKPVRTTVKSFGASLTLAPDRTVAWDRVLALYVLPTQGRAKAKADRWRAWLVGGEVVLGTFAGIADEGDALQLDVVGVGNVVISLDALAALEFVPAKAGACHDLLEGSPPDKESDVAYDAKRDALRGTVLELTDEGVALEDRREKTRRMAWADLRVLRLANDTLPAPDGAWAEVELVDGTRLHAEKPPTLQGTTVSMRTRSLPKTALRISTKRVHAIRWKGGAFVWASSLPFTSVVKTPADDHEDVGVAEIMRKLHRVRVDRRVRPPTARDPVRGSASRPGVCPLRVGGVTYRHGFAVHSYTEIKIPLNKGFISFQTSFGIDDEVMSERPDSTDGPPPRGDVSARILCDGEERWKVDSVKGGEKAIRVGPIDVTGVTELVLTVDYGPDKRNTLDRADWLEPILVRAK